MEGELPCVSCRRRHPVGALDRYLWCPACRMEMRRRGGRWGGLAGAIAALGVAAYMYLTAHASRRFLAFYLALLAITFVLVYRIALAVVLGYYRDRGSVRPRGPDDEPGAGPAER
jgi:hypothetical protein